MDHSHMDHSGMDHRHMDHGGMDHGMPMPMCKMNMLFNWDTTDLCIIFRSWHVRGPASLIFSLLAIVAICAGYEALREATRRYEAWVSETQDAAPISGEGEQVNEDAPLLPAGQNNSRNGDKATTISQRARVVKAAIYAVQNFYAFMIMLLFMTYNGFVMIAVAVGAGVGSYLFGSRTRATKETACH
ncbi:CTR2 short splice variant [Biscogniauxia marginata]|nr:CTR2 short splice variant [Biscogniauxia marginata]